MKLNWQIKLEEIATLLMAVLILVQYDVAWWWYLLLFLGPDISMIGYAAGNKIGAAMYNLFHHKGIGLLLAAGGWYYSHDTLFLLGVILVGHSAFDRILGYGLKYSTGFHYTHLGVIGNKKESK